MNVVTRVMGATWGAVKAAAGAVSMRFQEAGAWGATWINRTRLDLHGRVGDGSHNSIVIACRAWVERAWPEAPIVVRAPNAKGEWSIVEDHPLALLLRRPNPYYSGIQMLTATLADRLLTGNAYWLKRRGGSIGGGKGKVAELWWIPSHMMRPSWPRGDDSVFISEYIYTVNGTEQKYDPEDIVHFRRGFDPANMRLGRNDLADLLGEIFTDEEASAYVAAVLANMGVPGVVISPDGDANPSPADLDDVKTKFMERFGGDNRGQPLVMKGKTKVAILSFSPDQMKVRELRRIPEERVTAVLGIPAIVVGLGAGLDRSTFANMAEAREGAYEGHIIPDHRLFDADLETQLVPDFGDPAKLRVGHDYTEVRVLQADQNDLHARAREDWLAGLLTMSQALEMIGEEPIAGPEGQVRLLPNTHTVTHPDELKAPPEPTPEPAALPVPPQLQQLPDGRTAQPAVELDTPAQTAGRSRPERVPALAGATNGKATAVDVGAALPLSNSALETLSAVSEADAAIGEKLWRAAAEETGTGLENLLDAEQEGGDGA